MLHNGRIVESATPENFIRSKDATVQSFLESQYITRRGKWEELGNE